MTPRTDAPNDDVLKPTLRMLRNVAPVLDRAGAGAWGDMWRVAPPLAAIAWALKALRMSPEPDRAPSPRSLRAAVARDHRG
jgi:hypothetical protein